MVGPDARNPAAATRYPAAPPPATFAAAFTNRRAHRGSALEDRRLPQAGAGYVAKIVIGADRKSIDEAGVKFVLNPYDEFAVEEAIALKEKAGRGRDRRPTRSAPMPPRRHCGPPSPWASTAPSCSRRPGRPTASRWPRALAAELKAGGYDLILFGKLAVDDYNHQVGVMLAELLGLPCITSVAHLTIADGAIEAEREIEGGIEMVSCRLPAVLTCEKGLNNPRLPSLKGIMAAKKKPLETEPVALGPGSVEVLGLEYPAERKPGRIVGEGADAVPELLRLLRTEAKVL